MPCKFLPKLKFRIAKRPVTGIPTTGLENYLPGGLLFRFGFEQSGDAIALIPSAASLEQAYALKTFEDVSLLLVTASTGVKTGML